MFKLPLVRYVKKYPFSFTLQAIGGIAYNTIVAYGIVLLGRVIDAAMTGDFSAVTRSIAVYIGVVVFSMLCRYLKRYYVRDFAVLMEMDMRKDIFDSILHKSGSRLDHDNVGDLMSRTTSDVAKVTETIRKTVTEIWDTWLLILSYFVSLLIINPQIALLSSIFIPVSIIAAELIRHPLYKYSKQSSVLAGKISTNLQQILIGIPVLRLFGAERQKKQELDALCDRQVNANLKVAILQSAMVPVYTAVASVGVVVTIIMGGREVISGYWLIGTFWSFLTTFTAMAVRTPKAAKVFNMWHAADAAWERITEELGNHGSDFEKKALPSASADIEVKELSFQYPLGTSDAITNISFNARPDEVVGITGPVGCGKTALCLALSGIYEYSGSIRVNGVQLRDMSDVEKAGIISYLGHEQYLFSASVGNNITMNFGNLDLEVNENLLNAAIHFACLEDDIKAMANGMDTMIGERGVQVSGGQKQRIALARAIYQNRPLMLLDDPFSALDIFTEQKILERLKELRSKTIVIFSHRLGAFKDADRILVMRSGIVTETGTHDELTDRDGVYRQIYAAQSL